MDIKLKEQMRIKQYAIKDKIIINNLKNLRFYKMADEDTANKEIINKARSILKSINSYDAKPEKVIIKEDNYSNKYRQRADGCCHHQWEAGNGMKQKPVA